MMNLMPKFNFMKEISFNLQWSMLKAGFPKSNPWLQHTISQLWIMCMPVQETSLKLLTLSAIQCKKQCLFKATWCAFTGVCYGN